MSKMWNCYFCPELGTRYKSTLLNLYYLKIWGEKTSRIKSILYGQDFSQDIFEQPDLFLILEFLGRSIKKNLEENALFTFSVNFMHVFWTFCLQKCFVDRTVRLCARSRLYEASYSWSMLRVPMDCHRQVHYTAAVLSVCD